MARMLGKVAPSWCPICKRAPGLDCPDVGKGKRQVKARERDQVRRVVHEETRHILWAQDRDDEYCEPPPPPSEVPLLHHTLHGDNGCEIQGEAGPRERAQDKRAARVDIDAMLAEINADPRFDLDEGNIPGDMHVRIVLPAPV